MIVVKSIVATLILGPSRKVKRKAFAVLKGRLALEAEVVVVKAVEVVVVVAAAVEAVLDEHQTI